MLVLFTIMFYTFELFNHCMSKSKVKISFFLRVFNGISWDLLNTKQILRVCKKVLSNMYK